MLSKLPHREKDLDEVLQVNNVFVNVSKGEVAKTEDLKKAFGKADTTAIVAEVSDATKLKVQYETLSEILRKGELQVGDKERAHDQTNMWNQIATLVAEKSVDPATRRPYTVGIIDKAMTEAGFSLKIDKNAKSQVGVAICLCLTSPIYHT